MQLKKINPNLQKALIEAGLSEARELINDTFSTVKSGADCVISSAKGSGKTTLLVISTIQKLQKAEGESTRALIVVESKEKVLEVMALFSEYAKYTDLRIIGVNDKTDIDEEKNQISVGMDIIVGTPHKINALFSTAGFNLTTIRFFAVDDSEVIFKNRLDAVILRLAMSVSKTQYVFACTQITERVEILADKIMLEPLFFEPDDEDSDEDEEHDGEEE
ncbi:DEAD/DEAH box helicase [Flavobacterium sp.]|uniref:DEAD/DEAH box helicase n=1 Tax=Flavobacterium sp. TaxID=239 RepID=UPI0012094B56|nr:DEAD/DEAH box helicase [Flavobacterium sp.]RZJ69186.1 MAG: DEAD/DEAH box helicase [Flavobacterium sp.]